MANEAVKLYAANPAGDSVQNFKCSGATAFEKGALLALADERAAKAQAAAGEAMAGICAREHVAGSGKTSVAVHRQGDFKVLASGAIALGAEVISAGHGNYVKAGNPTLYSGAQVMGYSLATAADDETFQMRLQL